MIWYKLNSKKKIQIRHHHLFAGWQPSQWMFVILLGVQTSKIDLSPPHSHIPPRCWLTTCLWQPRWLVLTVPFLSAQSSLQFRQEKGRIFILYGLALSMTITLNYPHQSVVRTMTASNCSFKKGEPPLQQPTADVPKQNRSQIFRLQTGNTSKLVHLQITESRHNLSRSIVLFKLAFPWLTRVFHDSITLAHVLTQEWHHNGTLKFQALIPSNDKGVYLSITEFISDQHSYSIHVPESHHSSGLASLWSYSITALQPSPVETAPPKFGTEDQSPRISGEH